MLVVAAMLDHSISMPRTTPQTEEANQCQNHQRPGWPACSRLHLAVLEKKRHSAQRPPHATVTATDLTNGVLLMTTFNEVLTISGCRAVVHHELKHLVFGNSRKTTQLSLLFSGELVNRRPHRPDRCPSLRQRRLDHWRRWQEDVIRTFATHSPEDRRLRMPNTNTSIIRVSSAGGGEKGGWKTDVCGKNGQW